MVRFECGCGWHGLEPRIVHELVSIGTGAPVYDIYECACPSCGDGVDEVSLCLSPQCDEPPVDGDDYCVTCAARQDAEEATYTAAEIADLGVSS